MYEDFKFLSFFMSISCQNYGVLLYGIFIHIAMQLPFFSMYSWEIVALTTSGNRVRHIVSSQDDSVAGLLRRLSRPTENKEY